MKPDLADALVSLRPGEEWVVRDGEIEWLSETTPPTQDEVDARLSELRAAYDHSEYQRMRVDEYPPIAEFADAMYWMRQGDESKMIAYEAKVAAVKDKYPKPGA